MTPDYQTAREKYSPSNIGIPIEVLWVAESPPAGGGFFYFEKTAANNHLFRETMRAMGWWSDERPLRKGVDKVPYLEKFQGEGHFLIDLSDKPVNHLSNAKKLEVLRKNVPRILEELRTLKPQKILLVKRTVFDILAPQLRNSIFASSLLNRESIPFPSHGWQRKYREVVQLLLRK